MAFDALTWPSPTAMLSLPPLAAQGPSAWVFAADDPDESLRGKPWTLADAWAYPNDGIVPDPFFSRTLPFYDTFSGWISHAKATLPGAYAKAADDAAEGGKPIGETTLAFARAAMRRQRQLMLAYYTAREELWYPPLMPAALIGTARGMYAAIGVAAPTEGRVP